MKQKIQNTGNANAKKKMNRVTKCLISLLLIVTMTVGILPLSFVSVDAAQNRFQYAVEWAAGVSNGSTGHGSNPSQFALEALKSNTTNYNNWFSSVKSTSSGTDGVDGFNKELQDLPGMNTLSNPSTSDVQAFDILWTTSGSWGLYDGTNVHFAKSGGTKNSMTLSEYMSGNYGFGAVRKRYRYVVNTCSISNVTVSEVSDKGYRVTCTLSDTSDVAKVLFPTWTVAGSNNGQDDLKWHEGTISGNTATCYISVNDHNKESGVYRTHIYARDSSDNNLAVAAAPDVTVSTVDIGDDFYAYINVDGHTDVATQRAKTLSYDVNETATDAAGGIMYRAKVYSPDYVDKKQIWHFKRDSDGYYNILNYDFEQQGIYRYLDVQNAGTANGTSVVVTAHGNSTTASTSALWRIVRINTTSENGQRYYLVPKTTDASGGNAILNIDTTGDSNKAQLWSGGYTSSTDNLNGSFHFTIDKIRTVNDNSTIRIKNKKVDKYITKNDDNTLGFSDLVGGNTNQIWTFKRTNSADEYPAIYNIINKETGKYLQCPNSAGSNVTTAVKNDSDSQKWMMIGEDNTRVLILPMCCTKKDQSHGVNDPTISVQSLCTTDDNAKVRSWCVDYGDHQIFSLETSGVPVDMGDFYSAIKYSYLQADNVCYAMSMSIDGQNTGAQNTNVVLRTIKDNPAVDQQWHFQSVGNYEYVITNLASGKVLDVKGGSPAAGTGIQASDYTGSDSQKWYIVRQSNGTYSLRNKLRFDYIVDVPGANVSGDEYNNMQFALAANSYAPWDFDFSQTDSLPGAENFGNTFWAYISPTAHTGSYLHCQQGAQDMLTFVTADDSAKKKQENYWKFERNDDGSYTINSCCVEDTLMCRDNNTYDTFVRNASTSTNAYYKRWFVIKSGNGYYLQSKLDARVLTYTLGGTYDVMVKTADSSNSDQIFNIINTDLAIDSDMPNIKMRLFNYGRAINSASDAVLPFFNGARGFTSYVDTDGAAESEQYDMDDATPDMKKTLVNGYPYVTDNKRSEWKSSTPANVAKAENAKKNFAGGTTTSGSLKYLFDERMGAETNGFVKGSGTATSYNLTRGDSNYVADSNYQSQCFLVNNPSALFKKNEKNGLYYYDSLLNAACFERDSDSSNTGNFKVFDYTMSVPGAGYPYKFASAYSAPYNTSITGISVFNGNFYPFNVAHEEGDVDYGDFGERQKVTNTTDTNGYYVTNGEYAPVNYSLDNTTPIDCWFGMTLECEFEQTSDGTYNGKDVQFNFDGDDDVWVYVDGVLVLNIGGTHGAKEGTINFKDGQVTDPTGTTTLRALYDAAKNDTEKVEGQTVITQEFINENFDGNTFKKDTKHTLNFYYMERGGVVSSAKINFNLPKGTPSVTKEVDYSNPDFNDKMDYRFKIEQYNAATGEYEKFGSNVTYLLEDKDGTSVDNNKLTDGRFFTLKAGQTAYFHNIDDGTQYRVTELYDAGISKTTAQYTKSYIDNNGDKVIVDENGKRVAVDDKGNIVTDDSGYVVKVDDSGNIIKDENGNLVTYDYKLSEFTDTNDREMGRYKLETNVEQNIKFTNSLQTTGLKINEKVYFRENNEESWTPVDSVPDAVYNFSLRLFRKNSDGKTEEYGRKNFSIQGDKLSEVITFENLPVGVSYELWEYYPNDENHYYIPPEFQSNSQSDGITGSFVIAGESPGLDSGINGVLLYSGDSIPNSITVTNRYLLGQQVVFGKTDDKQSADVGETVNYTITSSIPKTEGFTDYTYKITDTMTSGLTFNDDSVAVAIEDSEKTLTKGTDYTFTKVDNGFELNVNVMGLQDYVNKNLKITYTALVNNNAVATIETNKAQLEYSINPANSSQKVTSGEYKEAVYSAKIVIDKYAADTNAKLSGAEFYLYKLDGFVKKYYKSDANGVTWVAEADRDTQATKMTTDNNGAASFDGVADGTYYLEEVKAPDGYSRLTQATSVTVNGGGDNPVAANLTVKAEIPNYTGPELPKSGGMTTTFLFLVGGALALGAAVFLVAKRRTNKNTL